MRTLLLAVFLPVVFPFHAEVFAHRDKTIHDTVDELSVERNNGYASYSSGAKSTLDAYKVWKGNLNSRAINCRPSAVEAMRPSNWASSAASSIALKCMPGR